MPDITIRLSNGETLAVPDGSSEAQIQAYADAAEAEINPKLKKPHFPDIPNAPGMAPGYVGGGPKEQTPASSVLPMLAVPAGGIEGFLPRLAVAMGLVGTGSFGKNMLEGKHTLPAAIQSAKDAAMYGAAPELFGAGLAAVAKPVVKLGLRGRAPASEQSKLAETILSHEGPPIQITKDISIPRVITGPRSAEQAAQAAEDVVKAGRAPKPPAPSPIPARRALPPATRVEETLAGEPPVTWEPVVDKETGETLRWIPSPPKPVTTPPGEIPTFDRLQPTPGKATLLTKPGTDAYTDPPFEWKYNKSPSRQAILETPDIPMEVSGPGMLRREVTDLPGKLDPAMPSPNIPRAVDPSLGSMMDEADSLRAAADAMQTPRPTQLGWFDAANLAGLGGGFHHLPTALAIEALVHGSRSPSITATVGQGLKAASSIVPNLMRATDSTLGQGEPVSELTPLLLLLSQLKGETPSRGY